MIELAKPPKVDYTAFVEVIATNIQISQLKEVVPQSEWNKERFDKEREYFLWWLKQSDKGGRFRFTDQLSAWEAYKVIHEPIELDEDEEFTPSWMDEIDQKINEAISIGNYNEFGGQL